MNFLRRSALLAPVALLGLLLPDARATSGSLASALDSVRTTDICSDVRFIASDELSGRDSPSPGLRIAARFLRARMQRLGFEPGAREGFLQTYEVPVNALDIEASGLWVETEDEEFELEFGVDYFYSRFGLAELEVDCGVTFCGGGSKEELEAASPKGDWALCHDSGGDYRALLKTVSHARRAGARGVIVTPGDDYEDEPYDARLARSMDAVRDGTMRPLGRRVFPLVFLAPSGARKLLEAADVDSLDLGDELEVEVREKRSLQRNAHMELENVCAFWPGSDPELHEETILVSAHYDHVGTSSKGEIYNGADDNGSGTAALMALGQALADYGPMRRSVMLIWVSAEEKGLLGSEAWTEDGWIPGDRRPICDINIDMVGRNAPDKLLVTPSRKHREYNGLARLAERHAPSEGFPELGSCDSFWERSDHVNFANNLKIPVTFLFSGVHEDYHRPTDTADKVDCDKVRRVTRLVFKILDGLQADELDL